MNATRSRPPTGEPTEPAAYGTPGPGAFAQPGHDFTLQAIMELQRSNGQLTSTIDALQKAVERAEAARGKHEEKLDGRIDKIDTKLSGVTHKIYAAGVVLAILVAVGGFVVSKAWDLMAKALLDSPKVVVPVAPTELPKAPASPVRKP